MKKIFLIAFVLFSLNSMAQVSLGMAGFGFIPAQDTVLAGGTDTFNVWVRNNDTVTFNDTLHLATGVRDSTTFSIVNTVSTYSSSGPVILAPGDSSLISISATYNVSPVQYRYGIDVIVIWPYANTAITLDSLEFSVYIVNQTGIDELDVRQVLKGYPNPATDHISIENTPGKSVESISIYDISGKMVLSNRKQNTIGTESLAPGIYHADVVLSDKKHYSIKIIKQKNDPE